MIQESEKDAIRIKQIHDQAGKNGISTLPEDKIDKSEIFKEKIQRQWDTNHKLQGVITNLTDIQSMVLTSPKDLFARSYGMQYHSMAQGWLRNADTMPRFRELKIYYNGTWSPQDYQEFGYLMPIKHTIWQKPIYLKNFHTPRIVNRDEEPVTVEQADRIAARRRHKTRNKV
jgi:hypothetical protein